MYFQAFRLCIALYLVSAPVIDIRIQHLRWYLHVFAHYGSGSPYARQVPLDMPLYVLQISAELLR